MASRARPVSSGRLTKTSPRSTAPATPANNASASAGSWTVSAPTCGGSSPSSALRVQRSTAASVSVIGSASPDGALPSTSAANGDSFGELLGAYRRAAGVSQRELADRVGISVAAIRDLEQGRTRGPRRRFVDAMAAGLGLTGDTAGRVAPRR
jgi:hypothetical protein